MAVGKAANGGVEAHNDGGAVDLVDGASAALEVTGADVFVDADPGADGESLEGLPGLVGVGAAPSVVDGVDERREVVVEVPIADGFYEGVDAGRGLG